MLTRLVGGAAAGAALGGGSTLANGGTLQDAARNALLGGGLGAGVGAIGGVANKLMSGGVHPEVAQLADAATNKYGIPLRAGQITTNPTINRADALVNKLPMSGGTASYEAQTGAFTRALANEMGENADALTPQVMQAAKTRIGNVFNTVAANTPNIPADPQFDNDLLNVVSNAQGSLDSAKMQPVLQQFDNILNTFKGGGNAITGQQYQALTSRNSMLMKAIAKGGDVGQVAGEMKDALDSALQRAASPEDVKALQGARYQWKVMRTVEDMAEKAPTGGVSPPLLMGAVRKNFPNMAYDGGGNMGELARIGQQFLKAPSSSGTAENAAILKTLGHGIGLGGGGLGAIELMQNPALLPAAGAALVGGGAASAGLGALMRSKFLANRLIQSGLKTPAANAVPAGNLLLRALEPPVTNALLRDQGSGPLKIVVRGATPIGAQ
jgi:hypothetical protein